jgi:hypothetical protein
MLTPQGMGGSFCKKHPKKAFFDELLHIFAKCDIIIYNYFTGV